MVVLSAPVGGRFQIKADALVEMTDTGARTGLNLVRLIVLRQASDRVAFGGGYALVHGETAAGTAFVEHRAVQELDLGLLGDTSGLLVTSRTRLEERDRQAQRGVALRLRQQTRLEAPLDHSVLRAVVWNEYFHSLNGTDWSGPAGPNFMLTFVGLRVPVTKAVWVEPGYINQITFGSAPHRFGHIVALTVGVRF